MLGFKRIPGVYISIMVAVGLIIAVILSRWEDKEYHILGILFFLIVFNIVVIGKRLCLYRETSPKWLKISIKTLSTIASFSLVYLIMSIFIPTLPIVDIIELVCEISFGAAILLIIAERKIFGLIDNSHDLMNDI